jgi:hypothetical protein
VEGRVKPERRRLARELIADEVWAYDPEGRRAATRARIVSDGRALLREALDQIDELEQQLLQGAAAGKVQLGPPDEAVPARRRKR